MSGIIYRLCHKEKWKVVDSEGKTLETFRGKLAAMFWKSKNEIFKDELEVLPL